MKRALSLAVTIFGIFATMTLPALALQKPPPGYVDMGGLKLTRTCQIMYGHNYKAGLVQQDAFGWRCVPVVFHAGTAVRVIDMTKACEMQYAFRQMLAFPTDPGSAGSWQCYRSPRSKPLL